HDPATANYHIPAYAASGLSALALVLSILFLKESLSPEIRASHATAPRKSQWRLFRDAVRRPILGQLIALTFLSTFVFAGMEATFAMWSNRQFGWGPAQNGYLFAFVGLLSALIQGGLISRLAKKFGESGLIVQGAAALSIGLLLIPLSGSLPMLVVAMVILAYGFSVITPSLNSLISKQAGEDERGGILGITRSASIMARVMGPTWAGYFFHILGKEWPYFGGALIMAVVVIMAIRERKKVIAGSD
ncbi:MAG: MFS transporter, partial [Rhodospirillales bacterium]|nr:MFS transporter [Rhodospirillales bacterium]